MSYHSIHLEFPASAPFDRDNWFETFIGQFVKPLLSTNLVKQYWFTRYGDNRRHEIRLRLVTDSWPKLEPTVVAQIAHWGFTDLKDEPHVTVIGSFLNDRVISPDSPNSSADDRGQKLLNLNHAIAELFVDCLVGPDADQRFRQEKNTNINNPHGSIFETVHHLLCNTTDVVTEIELFKFGNNLLGLESPLYAHGLKAQITQQNSSVLDMGKFRVRF